MMMFKWVGALLGLFTLGIVGAVLGFLAGSFVDRIVFYGVGAVNPLTGKQRQAVFLETAFTLMGRLAKADGRISQAEIDHAETVMTQMGVRDAHRQMAIEYFRVGASGNVDVDQVLNRFLAICGHTLNLRQVLLGYLVTIALADGVLDADEQSLLRHIALRLGFSEATFERLLSMLRAQSHFAGGQAPTAASALQNAYAALGVSENDGDAQIKKAYRRLMSQNHPDKLIGQGLPEDMIKAATEQAKEIQAAYDLIMKNRRQH